MSFVDNPVINSPFAEPRLHYRLNDQGQPTGLLGNGRRPSMQIVPVPTARRRVKQSELELGEVPNRVEVNQLVNDIREQVGGWRRSGHPGVGPETRRLLAHWSRPDRARRLFFCQVEALETLIYLTEADPDRFRAKLEEANGESNPGLFRLASKMATGSGKTAVMGMIIAWHSVNKARRPRAKTFTDAFLVVCPGITIKHRLRVLQPSDPENIYETLDLVPPDLLDAVRRARIVITNYHGLMLRETEELSKLNRQILGGRNGEKSFLETEGQMVARVAKELIQRRDILVLNDEAHHCYRQHVAAAAELEAEEKEEAKRNNEEARVWINGIEAFNRVLGVKAVFDLSATPFFLRGAGHPEGTLFPWVVSDFGLLDAIESGIVKVPRLPMLDGRDAGKLPLFRNVYARVKDKLPKKGRAKHAKGSPDPQPVPALLASALDALYDHYAKTFAQWEKQPELGRPPVFIIVCNNTATSKLVYDYVAGSEIAGHQGDPPRMAAGKLPLFRNVDEHGRRLQPMRSLLIDSEQLDSSKALSDEFLNAAEAEIDAFKSEMRRRGGADADTLSDEAILREVMNTVGRPGRLGGAIRCVVAVSMLSEGWDANTVTHILGVRAFGTQLLCEQVVGRGLRRVSYEVDPETGCFPVEYADVLGIPFTFVQSGKRATIKPPPKITHVKSRRDRPDLAIRWPRVEAYRILFPRRPLRADFTSDSDFHLRPEMIPTGTEAGAFVGKGITLDLRRHPDEPRLKSVIFDVAGHVLNRFFKDADGNTEVWRYPELVRITERWFDQHLHCHGGCRKQLLKWRQLANVAAEKIHNAVARSLEGESGSSGHRLPILDPYNPEGSTDHVDFTTSKTLIFGATNSPLTHVVGDSEWELAFAERLEQMGEMVLSYVKNHALHFEIPVRWDGSERRYRPDYILKLDDGRGPGDPLHLIVEINGLREVDQDSGKADAAAALWLAAVGKAGRFGRWAFIEISAGDIQEIEAMLRSFVRVREAA